MPITCSIDPDTLIATVSVSDTPDQTVNEQAVWEMEEQVLLDHPDLSSNLRGARFQYLGVVERGGKGKSAGTRTLLYTRPTDPVLVDTPLPIDGTGVPEGVKGTPVAGPADPAPTPVDELARIAQREQAAAAQEAEDRVARDRAAIAKEPRDPQRSVLVEEKDAVQEQGAGAGHAREGVQRTDPPAGSERVRPPDRVDPNTGESLPPEAPSIPQEDEEDVTGTTTEKTGKK
jgi:hypothetical protein